jgi:hypothetical protein
MRRARRGHVAVVLVDGRVLVTGGWSPGARPDPAGPPRCGELFDPVTRIWTKTGLMTRWRYHPLAVLLQDGRVLVAGGYTGGALVQSKTAEIYDPATGNWKKARTMRAYPTTATVLTDGRVLVTHSDSAAEIFNPDTGHWNLAPGRRQAMLWSQTTLLPDGDVLAIMFDRADKARAVRYDPLTGVATPAHLPRTGHGPATMLADGTVLVAGSDSFARFDALAHTWIKVPMPPLPRDFALSGGGTGGPGRVWVDFVVPLLDGRALASEGGSTAIYDPAGR